MITAIHSLIYCVTQGGLQKRYLTVKQHLTAIKYYLNKQEAPLPRRAQRVRRA